jgi:hypothetical protein
VQWLEYWLKSKDILFRFTADARGLFPLPNVQTNCGTFASNLMDIGAIFPVVK